MVLLLGLMLAVGVSLAERDVRGVVDGWLVAQNAGDFAVYDKLYAAKFTGIRRSGPRTVRFDRAGWMRDRARMFGKPMTVAISDVKIRTGGAAALVSFTQTFAQGSYKDAGPKQLVIVRNAGALRIASEKMLRSNIESAPVPADERFRFVVSGGLLLSQSPDEGLGDGRPDVRGRRSGGRRAAGRRGQAAARARALAGAARAAGDVAGVDLRGQGQGLPAAVALDSALRHAPGVERDDGGGGGAAGVGPRCEGAGRRRRQAV